MVCKVTNNSRPLNKKRKKADIPVYSFAHHQRQPQTTTLYSPRVLILEGILALHDPRIMELLDVKVGLHSRSRRLIALLFLLVFFFMLTSSFSDLCRGRHGCLPGAQKWVIFQSLTVNELL